MTDAPQPRVRLRVGRKFLQRHDRRVDGVLQLSQVGDVEHAQHARGVVERRIVGAKPQREGRLAERRQLRRLARPARRRRRRRRGRCGGGGGGGGGARWRAAADTCRAALVQFWSVANASRFGCSSAAASASSGSSAASAGAGAGPAPAQALALGGKLVAEPTTAKRARNWAGAQVRRAPAPPSTRRAQRRRHPQPRSSTLAADGRSSSQRWRNTFVVGRIEGLGVRVLQRSESTVHVQQWRPAEFRRARPAALARGESRETRRHRAESLLLVFLERRFAHQRGSLRTCAILQLWSWPPPPPSSRSGRSAATTKAPPRSPSTAPADRRRPSCAAAGTCPTPVAARRLECFLPRAQHIHRHRRRRRPRRRDARRLGLHRQRRPAARLLLVRLVPGYTHTDDLLLAFGGAGSAIQPRSSTRRLPVLGRPGGCSSGGAPPAGRRRRRRSSSPAPYGGRCRTASAARRLTRRTRGAARCGAPRRPPPRRAPSSWRSPPTAATSGRGRCASRTTRRRRPRSRACGRSAGRRRAARTSRCAAAASPTTRAPPSTRAPAAASPSSSAPPRCRRAPRRSAPPVRWRRCSSRPRAVGADDAPAVGGAHLAGGGFDGSGYGPLPPGGLPVRVTLNGGRRDEDLLRGAPPSASARRRPPADGGLPKGAPPGGAAHPTARASSTSAGYCAFGTLRPQAVPVDAAAAADGLPDQPAAADLAGDGVRPSAAAAARAAHAGDDPGPYEARCASPAVEMHPAGRRRGLVLSSDSTAKSADALLHLRPAGRRADRQRRQPLGGPSPAAPASSSTVRASSTSATQGCASSWGRCRPR